MLYVIHMTALQHVYVTAHGKMKVSPWQDERAQVGVRLAILDSGDEPAKGSIFTIPADNGDVVLDTGATAGTHGTLTRKWSARLGPVGSSENADAAWQIDLAEDMWTFLNGLKAYQDDGFEWTHVKIAPIHADGTYGFNGAATYDFTTPLVGSMSGYGLPPEVACCVSFRAPISGRRGRGRMFIPALSSGALETNGTVIASWRTAVAALTATLVTNLENSPGTEEFGPLLMVTSAGSATAVRPSEIRIGDHFDAQRRRQHQAVETYTTTAL